VKVKGVVPILGRVKKLFAANRGHKRHRFTASDEALARPPKSNDNQIAPARLLDGTEVQV
jgi:hypothetical protein